MSPTPIHCYGISATIKIKDELEMHDRLIAATALFFKVPLITRDQVLKDSGLCDVIW